jgi:hypothetical protein
MYLDGIGPSLIAKTFNQEGVAVFGRGARWHRSYIIKLLDGTTVIGTYTPNTFKTINGLSKRVELEPIEDYFPAVIDRDTWQRVQSMRQESTSPTRGRHAHSALKNIFGGLARCPKCDTSMIRVNKGSGGKGGKPKLVCSSAKTGAGCNYVSVSCEQTEEALLSNFSKVLGTLPAGDGSEVIDTRLDEIEANIDGIDSSIERLLDVVSQGDSQAVFERLQKLEAEKEGLQQQHDELLLRRSVATGKLVYKKADDLKALLDTGDIDIPLINALLRQLLKKVVINYLDGTLDFYWMHGGVTEIQYAWPKKE